MLTLCLSDRFLESCALPCGLSRWNNLTDARYTLSQHCVTGLYAALEPGTENSIDGSEPSIGRYAQLGLHRCSDCCNIPHASLTLLTKGHRPILTCLTVENAAGLSNSNSPLSIRLALNFPPTSLLSSARSPCYTQSHPSPYPNMRYILFFAMSTMVFTASGILHSKNNDVLQSRQLASSCPAGCESAVMPLRQIADTVSSSTAFFNSVDTCLACPPGMVRFHDSDVQ
jgi:hypothetical protein